RSFASEAMVDLFRSDLQAARGLLVEMQISLDRIHTLAASAHSRLVAALHRPGQNPNRSPAP
ncbi:MAG: hypothetical protein SGPRY_012401, partial [Prymnesium sp.]